MTVVRLEPNNLFVHSPVALTNDTRQQLDSLGTVRFIVAPNRFHHLYVGDYFSAYPDAEVYAAPGLPKKRSDLPFHAVLTDNAPLGWKGEIEQLVFTEIP